MFIGVRIHALICTGIHFRVHQHFQAIDKQHSSTISWRRNPSRHTFGFDDSPCNSDRVRNIIWSAF
jgi:hypothetical protein